MTLIISYSYRGLCRALVKSITSFRGHVGLQLVASLVVALLVAGNLSATEVPFNVEACRMVRVSHQITYSIASEHPVELPVGISSGESFHYDK